MERFPVFRSRDPEETRAFLVEKQFHFDMAPRQRRELGAQLNGVYLPSMYLGYIEYGGAAVATTATSGRSPQASRRATPAAARTSTRRSRMSRPRAASRRRALR